MRSPRFQVGAQERKELESILRRQFVVRDAEDFVTSYDPADGDTLEAVVDDLIGRFGEPVGASQRSGDMVVWRDGRIMAVVRQSRDGAPKATVFRRSVR